MYFKKENKEHLASLLLRIGLAFVFFYAAVSAFISPQNWIGFFPSFLRFNWVMVSFSTIEIILGFWFLSNWKVVYPSIIASVALFLAIVFNLSQMDVVFRDVAIIFAALALAALSRK